MNLHKIWQRNKKTHFKNEQENTKGTPSESHRDQNQRSNQNRLIYLDATLILSNCQLLLLIKFQWNTRI